jgi:hypothetical protein
MGPDGAEIRSVRANRTVYKSRTVGQYLMVQNKELDTQVEYRAYSIVTFADNGDMIWYKHREYPKSTLLNYEEQQAIIIHILKSETW